MSNPALERAKEMFLSARQTSLQQVAAEALHYLDPDSDFILGLLEATPPDRPKLDLMRFVPWDHPRAQKWFANVKAFTFSRPQDNDWYSLLPSSPQLVSITDQTRLTDLRGLKPRGLRGLSLDPYLVRSLEGLADLVELEALELSSFPGGTPKHVFETYFRDPFEPWGDLSRLERLKTLWISYPGRVGLHRLAAQLPALERVILRACSVSAESLASWACRHTLQHLSVSYNDYTAVPAEVVAEYPRLKHFFWNGVFVRE